MMARQSPIPALDFLRAPPIPVSYPRFPTRDSRAPVHDQNTDGTLPDPDFLRASPTPDFLSQPPIPNPLRACPPYIGT